MNESNEETPNETTEAVESSEFKKPTNKNVNPNPPSLDIPYKEPTWSGLPVTKYSFEVLKSGVIIENVGLTLKKYWVFGRLPDCDIVMAHPTISRYHAVFQFKSVATEDMPIGFYIYDLGSTHGTFLNKNRIKSNVYVRVQVGHMLRFGSSTRNFILQGPADDIEPESELTVTQLKQKRDEEARQKELLRLAAIEMEKEEEERKKEEGIDWGMGEDADEETDLAENPYAATNNEELYLNDPKKTLRGFFEREGCDLEYSVNEKGPGHFLCRVELPVDDSMGRPVIAEAAVKGKKKEAVIQCAMEACRILDRLGYLRQATHESKKRKAKNWEEDDYYDSDDDTFLDRTGTIERKRELRMKMHGKTANAAVETYDSLISKEQEIVRNIKEIEKQIERATHRLSTNDIKTDEEESMDALDAFMSDLKDVKPTQQTVHKLKSQLVTLKKEHSSLVKLINIARPATLPPLESTIKPDKLSLAKRLPMFGKRFKPKPTILETKNIPPPVVESDEEEEVEEDEQSQNDTQAVAAVTDDRVTESETTQTNSEQRNKSSDNKKGLSKQKSIDNKREMSEQKSIDNKREMSEQKSIDNKRELSEQKSIDNKRELSEQKSIDNKRELSEQKSIDNKRELSEQKSIDNKRELSEQKSIDNKRELFEQKSIDNKIELSKQKSVAETSETVPESSLDVKFKVKGPQIPDNLNELIGSAEPGASHDDEEEKMKKDAEKRKKKNQRRNIARNEKGKLKNYDQFDEDYEMWVPPEDQKGDGKTKLNEKFGY